MSLNGLKDSEWDMRIGGLRLSNKLKLMEDQLHINQEINSSGSLKRVGKDKDLHEVCSIQYHR